MPAISALFPRHQRRGLIEAGNCLTLGEARAGFPRHQRRGLIEARSCQRKTGASGKHFRAIKGAVSLKPGLRAEHRERAKPFPRHQRRGLIEAPRSSGTTCRRRSFPRHQRRGLIEAEDCDGTGKFEEPYFRAIKDAVSLKQGDAGRRGCGAVGFPRHQRRGLIEAREK